MYISIIVPCFNEEENIPIFYQRSKEVLSASYNYEIIFVDDGSIDNTIDVIKKLSKNDNNVKYISFSRNFGHQNAVKAGMDSSKGDVVITIDADLQQPIELIPKLIEKWEEGYDVVYTIRKEDEDISLFKKITSKLFYKISNKLSDNKVEVGAADFRLLDRKVVDVIKINIKENFLYIRGLISWIGFKQASVDYVASKRTHGSSKYTLKRMLNLASNGITSFSTVPLKFSIYLGFIFAFLAFSFAIYALCIYFFTDNTITGWSSIIVSIMFFSGIILIMLGIIGEYIGKIFVENKGRPNYIVKDTNIELY